MPRVARVVVPNLAHHLTQRGNNRQDVFFTDDDRRCYLELLGDAARAEGVQLVAWCLMTNHVHLIAVPAEPAALERAIGQTHWRYAQAINRLHRRSGHLWQGRFFSCPLDDQHLVAAVRYVERNPVRAKMVRLAEDHRWSSAAAHCGVTPSEAPTLIDAAAWAARYPPADWQRQLRHAEDPTTLAALRGATRTGRPLATDSALSKLEALLNRRLRALPRGRPRKADAEMVRGGERTRGTAGRGPDGGRGETA